MHQPDDDPRPAHVEVTVVRTGGIAGMRREWRARPDAADTARWIALIEDCPWDAPPRPAAGADRYVWRILARCDDAAPREAELADGQIDGPWRTLVDQVRGVTH